LSELNGGKYVNSLAAGHLGPYDDQTTPRVTSISLRRSETSRDQLPNRVSGRVLLIASAEDDPTISAPGTWHGLPVAPALVTWKIRTWTGKVVLGTQVAADFRHTLPGSNLWSVYARGTYQKHGGPRAPLFVGAARLVLVQAPPRVQHAPPSERDL
jgi:hypothetical protein